jgi:hypothetical protein
MSVTDVLRARVGGSMSSLEYPSSSRSFDGLSCAPTLEMGDDLSYTKGRPIEEEGDSGAPVSISVGPEGVFGSISSMEYFIITGDIVGRTYSAG